MAVVSVFVLEADNGAVRAWYTYDDAAADPRILSVAVENTSQETIRFIVTRQSDGQVFTLDCGPGTSNSRTFNNSQAQRLALEVTPRGPRPVGYTYVVYYPAPT